jgi:hypothetical protein
MAKYEHTWVADDESKLTAGFDPDCAVGSMILVISTGDTYIKNTEGKWQKVGTTEVL